MVKFVAENVVLSFDFSNQDEITIFGETLASVTSVGVFISGTYNPVTKTGQIDPNLILNTSILATPTIVGNQVRFSASGGSSGQTYDAICLAVTSSGKTIESRFVLSMGD